MSSTVNATFEVVSWDEHEFDIHAGAAKLTTAKVAKNYTGDIAGISVTEWVMAYGADGSAEFVGIERIVGTVIGRDGTLVLRHVGTFEGSAANADLLIIGSASTGDLAATSGTGTLLADPNGKIHLDITFP